MATDVAPSVVFGKVRGVGVDVYNHGACVEGDDWFLLRCGVIEELFDPFHGFLQGGILLHCD